MFWRLLDLLLEPPILTLVLGLLLKGAYVVQEFMLHWRKKDET